MITAPVALTNPAAGVITTRPATIPEQKPSTVGLPRVIHSSKGHVNPAMAAESVVVIKALAAMPSAATALPALNPYQPTQSIPVPTIVSARLWGANMVWPNPSRLPNYKHRTKDDKTEDTKTRDHPT